MKLSDVRALPMRLQLLLAYTLKRNNPEFTVLESDDDFTGLLIDAMFTPQYSPTIGLKTYRIKPDLFEQLKRFGTTFVTNTLQADLKFFIKGKSAFYPWVW